MAFCAENCTTYLIPFNDTLASISEQNPNSQIEFPSGKSVEAGTRRHENSQPLPSSMLSTERFESKDIAEGKTYKNRLPNTKDSTG